MHTILSYFRDFFWRVDKGLLLACTLYAALLITCNYSFGIEARWLYGAPAGWPRLTGFFLVYSIAFAVPWLLWAARASWRRSRPGNEARGLFDARFSWRFVLLLLAAPAIFALKVCFPGFSTLFMNRLPTPWDDYWSRIASLPARLALVALLLALLRRLEPEQASFWGLTRRNFRWKPYALMLLAMVPLIAFAATQKDFQAVYPKLRQVAFIAPYVQHSWPYKLLFELSYGTDFVTIELFFRGFLVIAFVRYAGAEAVLPMAVFYCSIHFGKPLFECISSFFGGLLLGIVSYRTRSVLGGLMVHLGIAWMMEAAGVFVRY